MPSEGRAKELLGRAEQFSSAAAEQKNCSVGRSRIHSARPSNFFARLLLSRICSARPSNYFARPSLGKIVQRRPGNFFARSPEQNPVLHGRAILLPSHPFPKFAWPGRAIFLLGSLPAEINAGVSGAIFLLGRGPHRENTRGDRSKKIAPSGSFRKSQKLKQFQFN